MTTSRALAAFLLALSACAPAPAPSAFPAVDEALRPGAHRARLNGVELWYRVAGNDDGNAPPVVFLHGGPGQGSAHFEALAGPVLEPRLRMVYLDQRGSGRSERPASGAYSLDLLVDDVEALRRHLGVPRLALVGHSFGGALALEYAARYPDHVSGVVIASGLWDTRLQCRHRLRTVARLAPAAYARVAADTLAPDGSRRNDCELEFQAFADDAERDAFNTAAMFPDPSVEARIDSVEAARGTRNTGELGGALFSQGLLEYRFTAFDRVRAPVLVIAGGHDGAVHPDGLRPLAERLPVARFVAYESAGHFLYLDEPGRFARDVASFLAAAGRR